MAENKSFHDPAPDSNRFETDTQKIVRKHLEDKEHVISDEDIRNVRVGMTPPTENEQHPGQIIDEKIKTGDHEESKEKSTDDSITTWDIIEH